MYLSASTIKLLFVSLLLMVSSCSDSQNRRQKQQKKSLTVAETIEMNKMVVSNEQTVITSFVEDNMLSMQRTETGLWYKIDVVGQGDPVKKDRVITIDYEVALLDGTICYSSDSTGYKSFLVGKGGVEPGLEEGVLLLNKGSEATFILPSHLAHGLMGDDEKIPPRAILRYEVKVIDIKDK